MGLDMYMERRHYVKRWDRIPEDKQFSVIVTRGGEPYTTVKPERVSYVIEQVAYWRKANAIHAWFVSNVQNGKDDCEAYPVEVEQLQELLAVVNGLLDGKLDPAAALPTQSGFFFGNTDYDDDYRYDLEDTKRQIEEILSEDNSRAELYYQASW